jgi:hypothetical protein
MPGRLSRIGRPAIWSACVLALIVSFVVARSGEGPPDDPLVPAVGANEPAATTTSALGRADGLPALAPQPPRREPPPVKAPAPPAPAPAPEPASEPAPAAPAPVPEPAYTPPPDPVTPPPAPVPAPQAEPAPEPDPSPPVYFDDSG